MPHYADEETHVFPFAHTALWADADGAMLKEYAELLDQIVARISQADPAQVRNGLDHHRDAARFPSLETMLAFVARFREASELAYLHRYLPRAFWRSSRREDEFGRRESVYRDYREDVFAHYDPNFVLGIRSSTRPGPYVIAPGRLLGHSNAELIFSVAERSEFTEYWQGYPRRLSIADGPQDEAQREGEAIADLQIASAKPQIT
jgi:hypothetical protein